MLALPLLGGLWCWRLLLVLLLLLVVVVVIVTAAAVSVVFVAVLICFVVVSPCPIVAQLLIVAVTVHPLQPQQTTCMAQQWPIGCKQGVKRGGGVEG
jgi:hypothetical protein